MKVVPIHKGITMATRREPEQLDLLDLPVPLAITRLECTSSPKRAFYEVAVTRLVGKGYIVSKASGGRDCKAVMEYWWRPTFKTAAEKQAQLINSKLSKKKGRIYQLTSVKKT